MTDIALFVRGDDGRVLDRLRAAAWRGLVVTVFGGSEDRRAVRLARAAGAELGAIAPDTHRPVVLCPAGPPRQGIIGEQTLVVPDPADRTRWQVLRRDGSVGVAIEDWDEQTLDALIGQGVQLGPVSAIPRPAAVDLHGVRALHVTSVHRPDDGRIFQKEVMALRAAGASADVLALEHRPGRRTRIAAGWRLMRQARRARPDVIHIHDPELLPAAVLTKLRTGRIVIYDAHEYLGQTTRTKPWIPRPLRRPLATIVWRVEAFLGARLDAVVAVTEDMAIDFASRGADAISVANFAPRDRFPAPGPPEPGTVVYVGALDRSRGLQLMLEAFPQVDVPGARLILAGPGEPGPLPPGVEHVGRVPYDEVPALLARAAVIWIPLRRTPNNDLGRLTKVMEAMASGRPLVVSDLARTAAIMQTFGCGEVVPFDDAAAHARAITGLLRDPERAALMGTRGRRAFLDHLTFEGEAAKLVARYAELAGQGGGA